MTRKLYRTSLFKLLGLILFGVALSSSAASQTPLSQQPSAGQVQRKAPIEHYYWHFLVHQNELDTWAARQAANGHDGSALRNHLQQALGFSDTEYALVRASSVRLTGEVKTLDSQAKAIRAAGPSSTNLAQLKALTAQREADIDAEVSYLRANLSPQKVATFEVFIVRFFSPPPPRTSSTSPTQPSSPAAVQQ